jgi:aminoglycoside phosphotransferase (APT) family kinase protein
MRTTGVLARAELPPETEDEVRCLYAAAKAAERTGMVSHLDAAPKNVLLGRDGEVALLDFELGAAVSDPAYDPGFLAGHYLLMGENHLAMRDSAREAVRAILRGYPETGGELDSGWGDRVLRYAGLVMLYRIYGSSPAPYLSGERHAAIRAAGLDLLEGRDL